MGFAGDLSALESLLAQRAAAMGFPLFSGVVVTDPARPGEMSRFQCFGPVPQGYQDTYSSISESLRDPVLQRAKRSSVPLTYDQRLYVEHGVVDLHDAQAPFGYRFGIGTAIHNPDGTHFLLGMDGPDALPPEDSPALARMLADLHLMALHAQCAARRLLLPAHVTAPAARLSPRERQVLPWVLEGKTNWAIGEILSISEHTVDFHLRGAMRKLGCLDRYQAAYQAFLSGLI
jgi:DNA-binding CsgD family transcriptional regulator